MVEDTGNSTNTAPASSKGWESASVTLDDGMHFIGDIDGYRIDLDADASVGGRGAGTRPMRLLLLGMAGCTAMDVIALMRKKRQPVAGLHVEVRGNRRAQHPRVYTEIEVVYVARGDGIDPDALQNAIHLSETRYCSAMATLGETALITSRYEIEEGTGRQPGT